MTLWQEDPCEGSHPGSHRSPDHISYLKKKKSDLDVNLDRNLKKKLYSKSYCYSRHWHPPCNMKCIVVGREEYSYYMFYSPFYTYTHYTSIVVIDLMTSLTLSKGNGQTNPNSMDGLREVFLTNIELSPVLQLHSRLCLHPGLFIHERRMRNLRHSRCKVQSTLVP